MDDNTCTQCHQPCTSGWVCSSANFFPLFRAPHRQLFLCNSCKWRLMRRLHGLAR